MQGPDDRVIGIDLGMTSVVAAHVPGPGQRPTVIRSKQDGVTLASAIAIREPHEKPLVGQIAWEMLTTHPQLSVTGIKRLLGRKPDSPAVRALSAQLGVKTHARDGKISVRVGHRWMSPVELTSLLLTEVRLLAEADLNTAVRQCVIAVPAYFTVEQKQAVVEASKLAGMTVRQLVQEPSAAALAYELGHRKNTRVAIVDMGGVRLDVSVIKISNDTFEVLAAGGHPYLGGTNIDAQIMDWILHKIPPHFRQKIEHDPKLFLLARMAAEQAKRKLSRRQVVNFHVPLGTNSSLAERTQLRLDIHTLRSIASETIDRITATISDTFKRGGIQFSDIDEVLLVGGTTQLPFIRSSIQDFFDQEALCSLPPEQVIALGAALVADKLRRSSRGVESVINTTVGIALANGRLMRVLERSSRLPTTRRVMIPTIRDHQTCIELDIFEDAEKNIIDATYLGTIVYQGIKKAPTGQERVIIDLTFDTDHRLHVSSPEPGRAGEIFELAIIGHSTRKKSAIPKPTFHVAQELPESDQKK